MIFAIIVLFLILIFGFYRDIFFGLCLLWTRARPLRDQLIGLQLIGEKRQPPNIYVFEDQDIEAFALPHLIRGSLFVNQSFWKQLSNQEREALCVWAYQANHQAGFFLRLFGHFDPRLIDRSCLLTGVQVDDIQSLLSRCGSFRKEAQALGLLTSFSMIGPSILKKWPGVSDRLKALSNEALKINS